MKGGEVDDELDISAWSLCSILGLIMGQNASKFYWWMLNLQTNNKFQEIRDLVNTPNCVILAVQKTGEEIPQQTTLSRGSIDRRWSQQLGWEWIWEEELDCGSNMTLTLTLYQWRQAKKQCEMQTIVISDLKLYTINVHLPFGDIDIFFSTL